MESGHILSTDQRNWKRSIFLCELLILTACSAPSPIIEAQQMPTRDIAGSITQTITTTQISTEIPLVISATSQAPPTASFVTPTAVPLPSPVFPTNTAISLSESLSETVSYTSELSANAIADCPATPGIDPGYNWNADRSLGAGLWPGGIVYFYPGGPGEIGPDGSLSMKFWWTRSKVAGQLTIAGRRLDEPAPPLQAHVPDGYGERGFQASGLDFPTEGCWEVTGKVEDATLTFVTLVVKIPFEPLWPHDVPDELVYKRLDLSEFPKSIRHIFGFLQGSEEGLVIETTRGKSEVSFPYPEDAIKQVQVLGQRGICVQGAWDETGEWQSDVDAGALEWSEGGLSYCISYSGLTFTCEDLLRIASGS